MRNRRCFYESILLLCLGLLWSRPASAQFLMEAELGLGGVTADWNSVVIPTQAGFTLDGDGPILEPGFGIGGNLGFHVSPMFVLTGGVRVGLHGKSKSTDLTLTDLSTGQRFVGSVDIVESGASLELLAGARIYPMGTAEASGIQPYIGAGLGIASMGWKYEGIGGPVGGETTDAVGGFIVAGEGGLDFSASKAISLGVSARLALHAWASESVEGLDTSGMSGVSWGLYGRLGFHL